MSKLFKDYFCGLFILTVAFSYSVYMITVSGFGVPSEGIVFHIYSALLSVLVTLIYVYNCKKIGTKTNIITLFICFIVVFLFFVTKSFYNTTNKFFNSFFLSMGVRFIPALLLGVTTSAWDKVLYKIEKSLLPFVLFYTIVLAMCVLTAKIGANMNETFNIEGGMNYQTISYYSVFAFGMTMYLLTSKKNKRIYIAMLIGLALLQLYMAISAGGRGAFVLAIFFLFYYGLKKLTFWKLLLYVIIAVICFSMFESLFASNSIFSAGANRIFNFFGSSDAVENDGRWIRYGLAIDAFWESPLWGNGLGSVFYKVGFYSHNVFTDVLCEGGLLFFGLFLYLFTKFFFVSKKAIASDYRNEIIVIIFICSLTNLLFSGYYFAETGVWFAMAYMFCNKSHYINTVKSI